MAFLTDEQKSLAGEIAALLIAREETVAVAEATTGGLTSAALLWVAGASKYYAGGGVTYTLNSRTALAGADAAQYVSYQGTTPEMITHLAESMRQRLGATWCIAESGLAGPTPGRSGAPPGKTTIGVAGPVSRTQVFETGIADREANMIEFTTLSLRFLRDVLRSA
ncbi:MAG TPA: CinA family protein [Dehalococcoidia bacterium]|nr:CinA family protein [Dehalococcoidia bacterium]